ncbi:MAG: type II toxin-antitoxin system PemK/MazF family toxin [Gemmatimonadetes bacterium]|nr:type II toxin-antitoxin system PemK/MazF family toxin [Gemmatimonadota bacterium]
MSEAVVHLGARRSKAVADQLTTATKSRLSRFAGALTPEDMPAVERALALQLGLALPGSTEYAG